MRYREVRKGMKFKVYRSLTDHGKQFVGMIGRITYVFPNEDAFPIRTNLKSDHGSLLFFSHKELKELKEVK